MADIRISELPQAGAIQGTELVPIVQNGQTVQTTTGAISASPSQTQTFLTVTQESTLPNSRYFGVGLGLGSSDAGIQGLYQIYLDGTSASLENASTGIIVKSGVDTITPRQIATSGAGLSIADGSGVSGNPTLSLSGLPASLASLSGNGILAVNGGSSIVARTLTGTANQISIANATGTANPTFSIADNPVLGGTAGMVVPSGTTGERPVGVNGTIRYNSSLGRFEVYANSSWQTVGAGDGTVTQVNGTVGEIDVINGSTNPTIGISDNAIMPGTGAIRVPSGNTSERGLAENGRFRYNTQTLTFEGYSDGLWREFAVTGGVTSFSGGTTGLTPATSTTGAITLGGTLGVANGGTGATTLTGYLRGNGASAFTAVSTIPTSDLSGTISNAQLANSAITINGSSVSLGGSVTVTATATNALTIGTGLSGTSYNGSTPVTIAISSTGVVANTYGSASAVPVFAVNAQGQITSVTNTSISIASSAITDKGLANGVASLDAGGTVPLSQIPASIQGGVSYQGTWNASTNTPTLTSSVGSKGYYYVVSTAGNTNLNGITDWQIGDWAIFNGSIWEKIDNTDAVTSVNGYTGTVVLTASDVGAQPAGTYVTSVSGTAPIASSGGTTPAISISQATSSTNGYLSSTDWTTFNNKANSGANSDITSMSGLTGAISSPTYIQMGSGSGTTLSAGRMWYDQTTGSWNMGMGNGNITQQVGEELFVYGKASSTISDNPLQIVYQTGVVGSSGVVQFAPTIAGITNGNLILGCATENIATNGFGRITSYGLVRGINTSGSSVGETWADGDIIWYNPVTGNPTKNEPTAPNIKVQIGIVTNAGSGGSGSFFVLVRPGSVLGGTDSNVQFGTLNNTDLIQYNGTYWTNVSPSTITVGTATNATNVAVTADSTNATRYVSFVGTTTGNNGVLVDSDLTYNPSTNTMTVGTLVATVGISGGTF